MFSFMEESLLHEFFIFDASIGRFCDRYEIFACLARNYYMDTERLEELYKLAVSHNVDNIASLNDHKRYCRLRQYKTACKIAMEENDYDNMIAIKGSALNIVHACGLDYGNSTKTGVIAKIAEKAKAGHVAALRLCGVLQIEGILLEKDIEKGRGTLIKAARWNNIESVISLIRYDNMNIEKYINMLFTLTVGTPYECLYKCVQSKYGATTAQKVEECVLLAKAFDRGLISADIYAPVYADLLYSKSICFKDKEKILLSGNKDAVMVLADLPLKLEKRKLAYNSSAITELSLTRNDERDRIIQNAVNSDMRNYNMFRPLCLNSDSRVMRNYYATAITKLFDGAHIARIMVEGLSPYDFEPSPNNVFLRNCMDEKNNVFIIEMVGDIADVAREAICSFLQSARREKMRVATLGIDIDLSSVLPICLCDRDNAQALEQYCDRVEIAPPDLHERTTLIQELIAEKIVRYGIAAIEIEESVMAKLGTASIDAADSALDAAILANRSAGQSLKLTAENAAKYIVNRDSVRTYGYGG